MVHKKEEGTYHHIEKLLKEMPGSLSPWERLFSPLIPEYSGINKEQRIPESGRSPGGGHGNHSMENSMGKGAW